jgi:pyridinium-3,5-biscarboxylic acid mononucleotide sulfurtransferase
MRALAVTALSPSFSAHDREHASRFIAETGLRHEFIETNEFDNPLYVANNANRCYFCKKELFDKLHDIRTVRGFAVIAYGANTDDLRDFRPGHRAATENEVLAPLLDAFLGKRDIRELSRRAALSTWDRPSSPCLSSRIPYGTHVTIENLSRVERAEAVLRKYGFRQFRVRSHGDTAQIEIAHDELPRALQPDFARSLAENVRRTGFDTVNVDPLGYRQGSLNAALLTGPESITP